MKTERRNGGDERRILTGMIVDPIVLGHVASVWTKEGRFKSKWSNLIGGWCNQYYTQYEKAPGKNIEGMFESWASRNKDKETIAAVERFLSSLSGEYARLRKEQNSQFIVDLASDHFNRVNLLQLSETLQGDIDQGRLKEALSRVNGFNHVELGSGMGVDVLRDQVAMQQAFESKSEPLITYPGALGKFFRDALERDAFISFMGPEKRGKSWILLDIAWRAMLQRRRVAFFSVGDLSQNQMMRRFQKRAAKRPFVPKTIRYPMKIDHDPDERWATVTVEERVFKEALSWQDGFKACEAVLAKTKTKQTLLRLSTHPADTLSVNGISSILKTWERDGWAPDVIVIDYADILAPPPGNMQSQDAINKTWMKLRALSQAQHCCVITATQANSASYKADTLDQSHFSELKKKMAHVTGMCGINQTRDEKEDGIYRLNWIVLRESEFNVSRCVYVAGCLDIGNPAVRSTF